MQKHDILHEFPEYHDKIHDLKTSDHHFRKLFDDYHEVDHDIHAVETGAMPTTDQHLTDLRVKRLHLKDAIYKILTTA